MKKEFKGSANKSGIYQIRNLKNGKIYIGSTNNFKKRAYQHDNRLNQGKHHNKHLLYSWRKYGAENFLFEILEVIEGTIKQRRIIEQRYIDQYLDNWKICYNLAKKVKPEQKSWSKNPEVTRRKKSRILKERWKTDKSFREKMTGEKHPSYGKPRAQEVKQAISKKALGNQRFKGKKHSKETKKKMSDLAKKRGISQKTREAQKKAITGKKQSSELIQKRIDARKGYKHTIITKKKIGYANSKLYACILVNAKGKQYKNIQNLSEFCRKHNLNRRHVIDVINKKRKHHKGWKLLLQTI